MGPVARFGNAALEFYFLKTVGLGGGLNYDEAAVARMLDGDLANNIGNLVSRIVKLAARRYARVVPPAGSGALNDVAHGGACRIRGALESFETARAARQVLSNLARVNTFLQQQAPWRVVERERAAAILGEAVEVLSITPNAAWPLLGLAERGLRTLGVRVAPRWDLAPEPGLVDPDRWRIYARRVESAW